jgi:hypothetical protein
MFFKKLILLGAAVASIFPIYSITAWISANAKGLNHQEMMADFVSYFPTILQNAEAIKLTSLSSSGVAILLAFIALMIIKSWLKIIGFLILIVCLAIGLWSGYSML